jgi:hypothetical protein
MHPDTNVTEDAKLLEKHGLWTATDQFLLELTGQRQQDAHPAEPKKRKVRSKN